jgi:predicted nucleotidyltransferase
LAAIERDVYEHVGELPDHRRVLEAILRYFRADPDAVGAWVSGSLARGDPDEFSDLDVGVCFRDERAREAAWGHRWDWPLQPWFHRFDADHVRPYFVIYLFEAAAEGGTPVKADIALYIPGDLPPPEGGPYRLAWDDTEALTSWAARTIDQPVDWTDAAHEDERFWAWTYYCLRHIQRGELYEVASELWWLRGIVETWRARLAGDPQFRYRRAESHYDVSELAETFPAPDRKSLKRALLKLIELHERQRTNVEADWRTSDDARRRIHAMVDAL